MQTTNSSSPKDARHGLSQKIPELDGIRGVAILFVIVLHFGHYIPKHYNIGNVIYLCFVDMGWIGVDLFFVLSGFLITRILLNTKHSEHYFKSFYLRRALRILPVYYLALFVFFDCWQPLAQGLHLLAGQDLPLAHGSEQLWYWFYLSNWQSAFGVYSFSPLGHLWSLAVEEQFYIVWPWVVLLCDEVSLLAVCAGLILVSAGLRYLPVFQVMQIIHSEFLYRLTPFRIEPLLFGAILAIIETRRQYIKAEMRWGPRLFVLGSLTTVAAVLISSSPEYSTRSMSTFGYTAVAITCFSVVLFGIRNSGSALLCSKIIRSPILTRCGKYSYAMYIVQTPLGYYLPMKAIYDYVPYLDGFVASLLSIMVGIGLSYMAARCSWALIEHRFLKLKERFPAD